MKKFVCVLLMVAVLFSLTACGSSEDSAESASKKEGTYLIGVSMKTMSDEFSNTLGEAIKTAAKEYQDVEIIFLDAQADISKQISNVEDMVAKNIDVLVLNAQDAEGSGQALDICEAAGIPVVEVNTTTTKTNYTSYVGSNDVEAGSLIGEFINEKLGGKGKVCIIEGSLGQSPQIYRYQGIEETLLDNTDIEVLAKLSADWMRDKAMSITEDWLGRYDTIDAILCEDDEMALGALEACEGAGRDDILIVGVDATPNAMNSVKEGGMSATVLQDAQKQAETTMEVAYKIAKGEDVEKEYIVPFQLITIDNVDDYL
ncbi:sugar ABC transporter substrate-binding protein [Eubacterium sp. am_0171]|uniref:substrate-binding domain-containing protein n=1 Tax=unclassified Eubacterium (in: firmicutes) TaxID=2624479 RepID=UPI0010216CF4|nr:MULTISPECIES: substrate-binding domain-containing protein [unclassified Eubacterium (in: firmicutes)]MSC86400.1 substrate-binding domain-containing protein [Eubacterium sp. BIOML-A1]MSD08690.1 substrate-binding domain-containing protein [Eubacterium sp. BIOML-A2]RYT11603.1 sugar ABC transporter substrate-binding protein [Eubacterium sp. am_0171]